MEKIIEFYMKVFESKPSKNDYGNWEVFKTKEFLDGDEDTKSMFYIKSVNYNYEYEKEFCFIEKYFPKTKVKDLENKSILDLGCFTGGRLIRWVEKFNFKNGHGIDINPIFKVAGEEFLRKMKPNLTEKINLHTGVGEKLPFDDESFDYIFSFDVLEHVQNVDTVISECKRVLKKDGFLLVVLPQFFQPFESHLGFVTKAPAIHWFFSGKDITKVYYNIIKDRGKEAEWYNNLEGPKLKQWEKLPSLNGITIKQFSKIVRSHNLSVVYKGREAIFADGKVAQKYFIFKLFKYLFFLPANLPVLKELFLSRINWVIRK